MKSTKDDLIDKAKERLLDPFEPVFPMPGMWHFIFGFIFSLVSFVGSLVLVMGYASLQPIYEVVMVATASFGSALLVILSTRGITWTASLMKFLSLAPVVVIVFQLYLGQPIGGFLGILIVFAIVSFVLLNSTSCKALINVLAIRRSKIIQMRKDGTYKEKLDEARRRWKAK